MTESFLPPLLIVADAPDALTNLGGISLLERWRRVARQIGYKEATILSRSVESIAAHIGQSSWKSEDVALKFRERVGPEVTIGDLMDGVAVMGVPSTDRILVVFANFYCDPRLLRTLTEARTTAILIDSNPPSNITPLLESSELTCAALATNEWISGKDRAVVLKKELTSDTTTGRIATIDAAKQSPYIPSMRANIRPIFFPAPSPEQRPLAEKLLRDATQKGVLDFPAQVHAPIEKWLVSHLCQTSVTPNQITLGTAFVGLSVTLLYATGHLWIGALLALVVGVLDGVDGKLARLKVQTTKAGKGEHVLDYFLEMSWWTALAYHFQITGQVGYAYLLLLLFFVSDVLDRLGRRSVESRLGRSLDDASRFDRWVRYVAGRRNIYTWMFVFCLLISIPAKGFVGLCYWGIASAAIHIFRAVQIRFTAPK
jgi:phosphatidylglycerophosphate synthase